jgi:hypothetical protein
VSRDGIALILLARSELDLALDEPIVATRRYVELRPADVQAAFRGRRWSIQNAVRSPSSFSMPRSQSVP